MRHDSISSTGIKPRERELCPPFSLQNHCKHNWMEGESEKRKKVAYTRTHTNRINGQKKNVRRILEPKKERQNVLSCVKGNPEILFPWEKKTYDVGSKWTSPVNNFLSFYRIDWPQGKRFVVEDQGQDH
jgi:hypothetical protein